MACNLMHIEIMQSQGPKIKIKLFSWRLHGRPYFFAVQNNFVVDTTLAIVCQGVALVLSSGTRLSALRCSAIRGVRRR